MEIMTSSILKSKSSKMDTLIFDLSNEIVITATFLNNIKEHSISLVENLNNIVLPSLYLQEFVKVNSVLLNYISLLTEINCKFEILSLEKTKDVDTNISVFHNLENLKRNDKFLKIIKEKENDGMTPQAVSINPNSTSLLCENHRCFSEPASEFCEKQINPKKKHEVLSDIQNLEMPFFYGSSEEYSMTSQKISDIIEDIKKFQKRVKNTQLAYHNKEKNEQSTKLNVEDILLEGEAEFDVMVEYIQSPSEFYVNFFSNEFHLFQKLQNALKEIPSNIQEMQNKNSSIKKSSLCKKFDSDVLYYSVCDESWYRAKVIDWNLEFDDDLVSIFLLDTGESKCIHIKFLQAMPDHIKKYPVFIKKCHLYNILPINMKDSDNSPNWMNSTCEQMKYWVEKAKNIKITLAPKNHFYQTSSVPVILWLVDSNISINELLINFNLAKQYMEEDLLGLVRDSFVTDNKKSENIQLENWNPMKEDFESYKNTYDLDVNDPAARIYGYIGNDYKRICRQFAKKGFCYKGKFCCKDHEVLNPLGYTTDTEKIFKNAYNSYPPPDLGKIYNIEVTCIVKINQFYCVIENSNLNLEEETLSTLQSFMNSPRNIGEMQKLVIPPAVGQIVIAKYSEDNLWYRAKVLESEPENDLYTVIFVDFGNKEKKSLYCIRAIEPRYLHLPFQAVKCNINGIEPNLNSPQENAIEYLGRKFEGKDLKIKVISVYPGDDLSLLVDLYDDERNDIGQDLVQKNYALPKNEIILYSNSEMLPG